MFVYIINTIKEKRGLLLLIGAGFIFVYIFANDSQSLYGTQNPVTTPFKVNTADVSKTYVDLLSITPKEQSVSVLTTFDPITFHFSQNIKKDSIKVRVLPNMPVHIELDPEDNSKVIITPSDNGWLVSVSYRVEILELESETGDSLRKEAVTHYKNIPPDTKNMVFPF